MVFTASSELTLAPGTGGHAPGSLPSGARAQIRSGRAENPQVNKGDHPRFMIVTLYRRVQLVAIWRRPKLTSRGDPDHDHVVAGIVARLIALPRRAVVLAEDGDFWNGA
jgi:hypothetical protein